MGTMISINAHDGSGSFNVYRAVPSGTPKGAILVIQEIFGVNAGIRAKVDSWAAKGYSAYAFDLFWREKPGVELDPDIPEQFQQAIGHMQNVNLDKAIEDVEETIRTARAETNGRVGVVGYCFGGLLAYLSATRTDSDGSVAYYGGGIHNFLRESHGVSRPLMMHFAEKDHFITADAVAEIDKTFAGNTKVEIHVYEGVDHGFASEFGKRRVEATAQQADARTAAFFANTIG